jgi:hypothetical protein
MALTGDSKAIEALKRKMSNLIGVPQRTAAAVAPILKGMIQSEFETKTDPFGNPWPQIKADTYRRGTKSILVRSGALQRAVGAAAKGKRVKIILGTHYAKYFISTRWSILPRGGAGKPESWTILVKTEAEKAFNTIMKG